MLTVQENNVSGSTEEALNLELPSIFKDSYLEKYRSSLNNPLMIPVLLVGIPVINGYTASVEFGKDLWKKLTD
jgi:hypothetical protein